MTGRRFGLFSRPGIYGGGLVLVESNDRGRWPWPYSTLGRPISWSRDRAEVERVLRRLERQRVAS